jgi:hypothetical protein
MQSSSADRRDGRDAILRERQALRVGGALAAAGGLSYFVLLLLHGDLPDETVGVALEHIAGRAEWPALKLALIATVLLWVAAFNALAFSLSQGPGWLPARLAVPCVAIGATLVLVEYSILGHEMKNLADSWHVASGAEREAKALVAEALFGVTGGLFLNFIAWMIGLPYVLMGLAVALSQAFPRWLGWIAIAAGSGALLAGTTRFLGWELVPFAVIYGGFVVPLNLWLAGMGVLMWQRASRML